MFPVSQEVLPSQQAMGALAASVHHLQEQVQEVRASSDAVKGLQATVQVRSSSRRSFIVVGPHAVLVRIISTGRPSLSTEAKSNM